MESLVIALMDGKTPRANQIASHKIGKPFSVRAFIEEQAMSDCSKLGITCIAACEALDAGGMTEDMAVEIVANLQHLYGVK